MFNWVDVEGIETGQQTRKTGAARAFEYGERGEMIVSIVLSSQRRQPDRGLIR